MNKTIIVAAVFATSASSALAGGLDRSGQGLGGFFEEGGYLQLSYGNVSPSVSGAFSVGGLPSGDMAASYGQFGVSIKQDINSKLSLGVILDQPYGASVDYPISAAPYPFAGTMANVSSQAITAVARYRFSDRFSVHGGMRLQNLSADATIPLLAGYGIDIPSSSGAGYLIGAAYEIPDIALRVALTYNSAIAHTLAATETGAVPGVTNLAVDTPQSFNLEFQSGVAADTLLFGSIRWVDWTEFSVAPPGYAAVTGGDALISYSNDVVTYTLGVGRKFSESFSGSVAVAYEAAQGGIATNLAPTDGFVSVQLGGKYTMGDMDISAGVRYVLIGDATTAIGAASSSFTDNTAIGVGVQVGYRF